MIRLKIALRLLVSCSRYSFSFISILWYRSIKNVLFVDPTNSYVVLFALGDLRYLCRMLLLVICCLYEWKLCRNGSIEAYEACTWIWDGAPYKIDLS